MRSSIGIDRRKPPVGAKARDAKTFGDLVRLYREDLQEVGKRIGRSKSASLAFLEADSGAFACRSLIENV